MREHADPIGFGLEHYDPIGRYRNDDNGFVIEDDDVFYTGDAFEGPFELAALIKAQPSVPGCVAEKLTTYAVGRGLSSFESADLCTIDDVAGRSIAEGGSLGDVVRAIVTSDEFMRRRGAPPEEREEEETP